MLYCKINFNNAKYSDIIIMSQVNAPIHSCENQQIYYQSHKLWFLEKEKILYLAKETRYVDSDIFSIVVFFIFPRAWKQFPFQKTFLKTRSFLITFLRFLIFSGQKLLMNSNSNFILGNFIMNFITVIKCQKSFWKFVLIIFLWMIGWQNQGTPTHPPTKNNFKQL